MIHKDIREGHSYVCLSDEEQLKLLATNGMLVKRPVIVKDDLIMTGFREKEWEEKLV